MARVSKSSRIQLWLDRLSRFSQADQSVAEFCSWEDISAASFYQWKRRLSPTIEIPKSSRQRWASSTSSFTELTVASASSSATTIRLPGGAAIELGSEQATVASVVSQVLNHCLPKAELPPSEASSC